MESSRIVIKTNFSFRKAVGTVDEVQSRLDEIGWTYFPVADISNTFAFHEIENPIYGVTLYVTDDLNYDKPKYSEILCYAKNCISEITKLVERATAQFHYIPLITYEQIPEDVTVIWSNGTKFDRVKSKEKYIALNAATNRIFLEKAIAAGFAPVTTQINKYPRKEDKAFYEAICGRDADHATYPQHILSDDELEVADLD